MNAIELVSKLREYEVLPKLVGGSLKLVGKTNDLPADFLSELKANKQVLIDFLQERESIKEQEIYAVEIQEYYPSTNAQRRIWVLSQFEGGNEAYNISDSFYLEGALDLELYEKSFQISVEKHESLRTFFKETNDGLVQGIKDNIDFKMEIIETKSRCLDEIKGIEKQLGSRSYDLEVSPLFGVVMIPLSTNKYIMVFSMHHIIGDGWSLGIFLQEVMSNYKKLCLNEPVSRIPEKIQFKDYASWLETRIRGDFGNRAKSYWNELNMQSIEAINLPTDFQRPDRNDYSGAKQKFYFDSTFYSQIEKLASKHQTTLFNLYRSVLSIVFHKWTNQNRFVMGTPVAGRSNHQLSNMIGLFVNTLPLVSSYDGDTTFSDYIRSVSSDSLKAFKHQDYPLDAILEDLNIVRDTSRNPLFDIMLVVQNTAIGDGSIEMRNQHGFTIQGIKEYYNEDKQGEQSDVASKFDISIYFATEPDQKQFIELEYKTKLFKKATIQTFYRMFESVLQQLISNDELLLSDINIVSNSDRDRILNEFNSKINTHHEQNILELVIPSFASNSSKIALIDNTKEYTYEEVDAFSNSIAATIYEYPFSKVGLFLNRSGHIVSSVLGIWKADKAYVPIDINYPIGRINHIVGDSGIELMLVDSESVKILPESFKGQYLNIDELAPAETKIPLKLPKNKDSVAYVIYTSGSTGLPKGVEITHRNVVAFLKWCQSEFSETPYKLMYAATSYCFDLSVFEMLLPLCQGKSVRVLNSGVSISEFINKDQHIFINTVPSVIRSLIDEKINWDNVVAINMAGEAVPRIFKDHLDYKNIEVRNLYGPSEDTTYSTCYRFVDDKLNYVPIGTPVGDTHLYILDKGFNLLPINAEGEICLSGESIAKGYLNQEALTNEKFVENPFVLGQKMYRTGDIGKWTSEGHVAFVGRIDDQVKVRGFRIELGEIQYQFDTISKIEQSVVIVTDVNGEKSIVAYFKCKESITESEIKEALSLNLPHYMLPSYYVKLDDIPTNSNGKVDKKMLPVPSVSDKKEIVQPKTDTQKAVMRLWEMALNTTGFGIEADFFELGGHSLKANKLKGLIHAEFDKQITLNEIFQFPDIPRLAELIDTKPIFQEEKIAKVRLIQDDLIPLSYAQERLWVLTKFENASKAYHMPAAFVIGGDLDHVLLEKALLHVIDRHESLRTLFKEKDGIPYQSIVETKDLKFGITISQLEKGTSIEDYLQASWGVAFDLEKGPLLRCEIIEQENKQILSFNMHHIISDGWSIGVLFTDLIQSYSLLSNGELGELKALEIQYKDFSNWQKQQLSNERLTEQLNYWKDEVFAEEISNLELPYDYLRPEIKSFNGATIHRTFSESLSLCVINQASDLGASLFMSLLANIGVLLKKLSNQSDIVIGTPVSGRDSSQLQQQIGFYINTLPVRSNVDGQGTFENLVVQARENILSAFNYQHFPFEMLVEEVQPKRDISRSPLFDVMLVMQNFDVFDTDLRLSDDIKFDRIEMSSGNTKYDLTFSFVLNEGRIQLELEYNTDLFRAATIDGIIDQFENVLNQTSKNKEKQIKDISLLTPEDQLQLLSKGDLSKVGYDQKQTIVSHFEQAAQKFGNHIALKVEGREMSYSELHLKSGQLARILIQEHNVQNEDLIVLHMDRSEWMIVSILGCLKAGAAYVPVDPMYPASKIEYILGDSNAILVLTDGIFAPEKEALFAHVESLDVSEVGYEGELLEKIIQPSQIAYIIYTSGTTGNPKGVMIEHRNVVRLLFNEEDIFDFDENDNWSLFHSYCFDFSVWEMYGALLKGGTLVMVPKIVAQDSGLFFDFLKEESITVLNQTPTAFRSLSNTNSEKFGETSLDVRYVIFGGEALMPKILQDWHTHYEDCKLINMYGITETTVHVTYKEITSLEIEENKSNIGKPIPTLSCFVLDADLKPAAPGVIGELCVGGAGVARGYYNREELTAEKFVPNPFNVNELIYRSGDFAKLLANGDLEYIGRKDEQVKIRGHRIELAEVEEGMKSLDWINDCVVIAKKNDANEFELISYYIENAESDNSLSIRESLANCLPSYMIPSHFIPLTEFPLTSNGKLDKNALLSIGMTEVKSTMYKAPENEIEQTIVAIWEEVLGKSPIGIKDNFFDLGGHSLKATRVISKIQEVYGIKIDLGSLFIDPTVMSLAKHVSTLAWMSEDNEIESDSGELII